MTEFDAVMVDAMLEAGAKLEEFAPSCFALHRTEESRGRFYVSCHFNTAPFEMGGPKLYRASLLMTNLPIFWDGYEELRGL